MAWLRIDDTACFHPKIAEGGNEVVGAWVRAASWCARHDRTGFIPSAVARAIAPAKVWTKARAVNLVDADDGRDGYQIHDFNDYNPTEDELDAFKEQRREAGRASGAARRANSNKSRTSVQRNDERNANGRSTTSPTGDERTANHSHSHTHSQDQTHKQTAPAKSKTPKPKASRSDSFEKQIFDHYVAERERHAIPNHALCKLTPDVARAIRRHIDATGDDLATCKALVSGLLADDWHRDNKRTGLVLAFRSNERDKYLSLANDGAAIEETPSVDTFPDEPAIEMPSDVRAAFDALMKKRGTEDEASVDAFWSPPPKAGAS